MITEIYPWPTSKKVYNLWKIWEAIVNLWPKIIVVQSYSAGKRDPLVNAVYHEVHHWTLGRLVWVPACYLICIVSKVSVNFLNASRPWQIQCWVVVHWTKHLNMCLYDVQCAMSKYASVVEVFSQKTLNLTKEWLLPWNDVTRLLHCIFPWQPISC